MAEEDQDGDKPQEDNHNGGNPSGQAHLHLRAGRDTTINIGIDAPPPEGGEDKKQDGKDQKQDGKPEGQDDKDKKPSPLKNPKIRIALIIGAIVLVLLLLLWLYHYLTWGRYQESTNDAYLKVDQVTVSPQTAGYVLQVLVDDNQAVKAGQVLVRIDPAPYQAKYQQALAQMDVARADIARYTAEIGRQQAQIVQAQAQLAGAQTNTKFYNSEVNRYRPLSAAGAETSEKLAQLENSAREAKAEEESKAAAVLQAQRMIASLEAQIQQAQAQLELAGAQAKQAQIDLDYTNVHASMDGRIGDKTVRVGQYVQTSAKMMSLVPVGQIYLEANFKENQIGLMRVGQPVTIRVDTLRSVRVHGRVASFSPGTGAEFSLLPPENATGNFTKIVQRIPVRIAIDADDETRKILLPGLSVEATVNTIGEKDFPKRAKKASRQHEREEKEKQKDQGRAGAFP